MAQVLAMFNKIIRKLGGALQQLHDSGDSEASKARREGGDRGNGGEKTEVRNVSFSGEEVKKKPKKKRKMDYEEEGGEKEVVGGPAQDMGKGSDREQQKKPKKKKHKNKEGRRE